MEGTPVRILLVEDDPADARSIQQALWVGRVRNEFHHVRTGLEALAFLRREGPHSGTRRPDLILLGLGLPDLDGPALVEEIERDALLEQTPIILLAHDEDLVRAAVKGRTVLRKPVDPDEFLAAVRSVGEFWVSILRPPRA